MALMERIVRPHSPVDTGPSKLTPKCRDPYETTTIKYHAPPGMVNYSAQLVAALNRGPNYQLKDTPTIEPQQKTLNSSWAYAYKKYMTKKEKEISKAAEQKDGVVQDKAGQKSAQDTCVGSGGDSSGSPGSGPTSAPTTTQPSSMSLTRIPTLA